jgi:GNAT superfamily N-acetyltransferase
MVEPLAIRFITEEEGRPLRWTYLRPGMPTAGTVYDQAADAIHAGAFVGKELIGSASLLLEDEAGGFSAGVWRLRGMIIHPDWRNRGVGGKALEFAVTEAVRRGARLVWCNGRTAALDFYRRHGFHPVGAEFETPGTGPHYRLIRPLDEAHPPGVRHGAPEKQE